MASIVSVIVNDDLDGSEGAETVTFGLDGSTYEIDLSEKNRARLQKALAPYVSAGRRISRSHSQSNGSRSAGPRVDRAAIRAWAKEQGITVSERGRISREVMQRYEATL
jgi:Lsr2